MRCTHYVISGAVAVWWSRMVPPNRSADFIISPLQKLNQLSFRRQIPPTSRRGLQDHVYQQHSHLSRRSSSFSSPRGIPSLPPAASASPEGHKIQTCPNKVLIGQEGIGHREFYIAGIPGQTRDVAFRAIGGEEL
jgi:hypothetical protein